MQTPSVLSLSCRQRLATISCAGGGADPITTPIIKGQEYATAGSKAAIYIAGVQAIVNNKKITKFEITDGNNTFIIPASYNEDYELYESIFMYDVPASSNVGEQITLQIVAINEDGEKSPAGSHVINVDTFDSPVIIGYQIQQTSNYGYTTVKPDKLRPSTGYIINLISVGNGTATITATSNSPFVTISTINNFYVMFNTSFVGTLTNATISIKLTNNTYQETIDVPVIIDNTYNYSGYTTTFDFSPNFFTQSYSQWAINVDDYIYSPITNYFNTTIICKFNIHTNTVEKAVNVQTAPFATDRGMAFTYADGYIIYAAEINNVYVRFIVFDLDLNIVASYLLYFPYPNTYPLSIYTDGHIFYVSGNRAACRLRFSPREGFIVERVLNTLSFLQKYLYVPVGDTDKEIIMLYFGGSTLYKTYVDKHKYDNNRIPAYFYSIPTIYSTNFLFMGQNFVGLTGTSGTLINGIIVDYNDNMYSFSGSRYSHYPGNVNYKEPITKRYINAATYPVYSGGMMEHDIFNNNGTLSLRTRSFIQPINDYRIHVLPKQYNNTFLISKLYQPRASYNISCGSSFYNPVTSNQTPLSPITTFSTTVIDLVTNVSSIRLEHELPNTFNYVYYSNKVPFCASNIF